MIASLVVCCPLSQPLLPIPVEQVPPGYAPFTFGQRVGAVVRNGEPRRPDA